MPVTHLSMSSNRASRGDWSLQVLFFCMLRLCHRLNEHVFWRKSAQLAFAHPPPNFRMAPATYGPIMALERENVVGRLVTTSAAAHNSTHTNRPSAHSKGMIPNFRIPFTETLKPTVGYLLGPYVVSINLAILISLQQQNIVSLNHFGSNITAPCFQDAI